MLDTLAPHSRVWIYQANRIITPDEQRIIDSKMNTFISQWASHGNELYGGHSVQENIFLIIGADEEKSLTSGCSVDSLNRYIKSIGEELKIDFFDRLIIAYVNENQKIVLITMSEFKNLMKEKLVTESTSVFNNLIATKAELDSSWRTNVKNSWHNNLLEIL